MTKPKHPQPSHRLALSAAVILAVALPASAVASISAPQTACPVSEGHVVAYQAGALSATAVSDGPRLCSSETGAESAEPTIGITPQGDVFLYPAFGGPGFTRTGIARSQDSGASWRTILATGPAGAPTHPIEEDPYMYVDPSTGRIFAESNESVLCDVLSISDDNAQSWATTTLDGCVTADHENIFAGPAPAGGPQPSGYAHVVYRCAYDLGATASYHEADVCEKSLDGGFLWQPTGAPAFVYDPSTLLGTHDLGQGMPEQCMEQLGHGVVGPDGAIYLGAGMCGLPEIAISHDEGATWHVAVVSRTLMLHQFFDGGTVNDTAAGVDPSGRLYALWIARDLLPYLATSTDGGTTWSAPVMIAPPGVRATDLPELAVGRNGRIAVAFMGSTNAPPYPLYPGQACTPSSPMNCANNILLDVEHYALGNPAFANTLWSGYLLESVNATRAHPMFLAATVSPAPLIRGACAPDTCQQEADFLDVRIAPDGSPWASYVAACSATCATAPNGTDDQNTGLAAHLIGGPPLR